ncbi:glycosyl hydrolase family 95 catalytic domain-containing protein [Aquiflexum sp.]|uniref:glycosyl hydrolase family 95 catalytic domain-containing protein n=1 Tax=Aquiflexum sp. TaxID=1872584 RepID=UPI003593B1C8
MEYRKLLGFTSTLCCMLLMTGCNDREKQQLPPYYMERSFSDLAQTWDEGIPLGNATLGALIWQKEGKLRFSLDRADLWDLRKMENIDFEKYDFNWVKKQWENNQYGAVQRQYDVPYDTLAGPSKIPGAALEFDISGLGEIESIKLDLQKAYCVIQWKNGTKLRTFVHATEPIGWYSFENLKTELLPTIVPPPYVGAGSTEALDPVSGQDLRRLGYSAGKLSQNENSVTYDQEGWDGFQFQVNTRWKNSGDHIVGNWSISSKRNIQDFSVTASEVTEMAFTKEMDDYEEGHLTWWNSFWNASAITLPDTLLQQQYYMDMYKLGAAARQGAPPISLQSVWTADNGKLPPWKGDFHHDLNTQLSYWPTYSGNHLNLEQGFIDWLNQHKPTFEKYTREYYGVNGLNVPGVTTLDGDPMGGWIQYSFGPTISAWLGHHFYLHWRYSMDREFLKNDAYPWIRNVAIFLKELSVKGDDGKRKLPLSSSPEIHNNDAKAWFDQMTNYDLSLVRWTFTTASELALELGYQDEAEEWRATLEEWPYYSIDETGLMIAPGEKLEESHRHFSQIMAIHPLSLIDPSNGEKDREIINNTIAHLDKIGTTKWTGYSFAWLANLKARAGDGKGAAKALKDFASSFVLPNSFHVNGDQSGTGKSDFTYRPFTLEGNFAFAAGMQEMLIQSNTGSVRLFPAIPEEWETVGFKKLRTEGAFLVSAERVEGKVEKVIIYSEVGGEIRLINPFPERNIDIEGDHDIHRDDNTLVISLQPDVEITLALKKTP